jgi:hypothetical protein
MSGFNYIKMSPDKSVIVKKSGNCFVQVLSEKDKQYAIYLHHSTEKGRGFITGYKAEEREFSDTLTVNLPAGEYQIEWINPSSGKLFRKKERLFIDREKKLYTPVFFTDIAARMIKRH